jgi:ABC-type nitrate/sulfonate/bicarbonate transport system substrate-binding protein
MRIDRPSHEPAKETKHVRIHHRLRPPRKATLRIGFMPLTDCAPLVMASVLGLDEKYGIKLVLAQQSWSGMRDRLTSGELDAAHALYGLLYGVADGHRHAPRATWRC